MLMNTKFSIMKIKNDFKNLNFYTIPLSILIIVRKRLNVVALIVSFILILLYTLI